MIWIIKREKIIPLQTRIRSLLRGVYVHVPSDLDIFNFYFRIRVYLTSRISFHVCIATKGRSKQNGGQKSFNQEF